MTNVSTEFACVADIRQAIVEAGHRSDQSETDLDRRLEDVKSKINESYIEFKSAAQRAAEYALRCGRALKEARKLVRMRFGYGQWKKWVERNCPFSGATAIDYIKIAQGVDEGLIESDFIQILGIKAAAQAARREYNQKDEIVPQPEDPNRRRARIMARRVRGILAAGSLANDDWTTFYEFNRFAQLATAEEQGWFFAETRYADKYRPYLLKRHQVGMGIADLLVDSGAYSVFNSGEKISLDDYCAFLKENSFIETYVNLDVIAEHEDDNREEFARLSFENFMKMRERGLNPIPVYHVGEDTKWLKRMLGAKATYIGLSATGIAKSKSKGRQFYKEAWQHLVDSDRRPIVKVHAFGETSPEVLRAHPWASADSTRVIEGARRGRIAYSPAELTNERTPTANARRTWALVKEIIRLESAVREINPQFMYYPAHGMADQYVPALYRAGHYRALVSYKDLRTPLTLRRLKDFITDPKSVLASEPYLKHDKLAQEMKQEWQDEESSFLQENHLLMVAARKAGRPPTI